MYTYKSSLPPEAQILRAMGKISSGLQEMRSALDSIESRISKAKAKYHQSVKDTAL